ncbi:lipoyltransferase 1 mitochondrial [Biomphalaria pfeifferi]|uniref:Lipoyltransferase 1 mitochondrial n=1 Tax=Biomphalaria pfeifferi TaxID=112525 RepID=A0AAD8AYZ0_BIOPF|nr:lipoyltransferase 1 mitochondrial [Biomphalaria pfeifferi]
MHVKKTLQQVAKSVLKLCIARCSGISTGLLPRRTVLISQSKSISENLALEEWLYENANLAETEYLLMWRNHPAVVFGRHQNPWLEANIPFTRDREINTARRASGGGTVYHDEGNLNLSFLMSRPRYNRRANLDLIVEALVRKWDIDLAVNQRNDIMLERFYKISGTAARLGRAQSFHHCTLLMSVDQGMLLKSLDSPMLGVESKATKSVPSSVMNLKDKVPEMTFELLSEVIGQHFLSGSHSSHNADKFEFIHPLDNIKYPGVDKILAQLLSWQWIYGKTPAFTIHRKFVGVAFHELCTLEVVIKAEQGKLTSLTVALQNDIVKNKLDSFVQSTLSFYTNYFLREEVLLTPQSISDMQQKYSKIVSETFSNSPEAIQLAKWLSDSVTSCFNFV